MLERKHQEQEKQGLQEPLQQQHQQQKQQGTEM
jgi:hypothetical protein